MTRGRRVTTTLVGEFTKQMAQGKTTLLGSISESAGLSVPKSKISESRDLHIDATSYIKAALKTLKFNCDASPSTKRTPERFANYLLEFMQPFDLEELLGDGFDSPENEGIHGMVIQTQIPFVAICEHHLLPMSGIAAVAYVPNKKLVGLSKLSRLVDAYGHEKPTLQEALTEKVASALFKNIDSKGSACVIKATHGCMAHRGIRAEGATTITSCVKGVFRDVALAREEFLTLASV